METFGGGNLTTRESLSAGDWVYCVEHKNNFYLAKVINGPDEDLMLLEFDPSADNPVSLCYVSSSSVNMIKLDAEPILNLHPEFLVSGHNICKEGYMAVNENSSLRVAVKPSRGFRSDISWVDLQENSLSNMRFRREVDLYYSKWEIFIPFNNSNGSHSVFRFGFDV